MVCDSVQYSLLASEAGSSVDTLGGKPGTVIKVLFTLVDVNASETIATKAVVALTGSFWKVSCNDIGPTRHKVYAV